MLTLNISTGDDPEADTKTDEHTLASTGSNATCQTTQNEVKRPLQASRQAVNTSGKAHICADCGTHISDKVASYSKQKFGRELCMRCQHNARESA